MALCKCGAEFEPRETGGKSQQYCSPTCANRIRKQAQRNRDKELANRDNVTLLQPGQVKPILKYPGAKWSRAKWITSQFPKHKIYLEPYCGSAAIFFNKEKVDHEIISDADGNIANLFKVLRERGPELARVIDLTPWSEGEYELCEKQYAGTGDEVEDARRFLVRCWQAHGTQLGKKTNSWRHRGIKGHSSTTDLWKKVPDRLLMAHKRLKDAEIRNRPALELIAYYNHPDCLIYADPPYVKSTRKSTEHYKYEMTDGEHIQLLQALQTHRGSVVLSGYDSDLYNTHLPGWQKLSMPTMAEHGNLHTEVLWLNPKASHRSASLFDEVV